ncbi:hypothetical protein TUMSATVNIG1_60870 (plasmid) [Vibrio nigripulchritudo]|nr:hypothetical protein VNTUMSATTG_60400 [Vibrio nigripulchritudo]BDU35478.1 hypothetical protein TUMSATVNIG1_60870 [Vibrio nigripulchritudo]
MNFELAMRCLSKNETVVSFTYDGRPLNEQQRQQTNWLLLYLANSVSILIFEKSIFNQLVSKTENGLVVPIGDGKVDKLITMAPLCALQGIYQLAEMGVESVNKRSSEIKEPLDAWTQILNDLKPGEQLECRSFANELFLDEVIALSNSKGPTSSFQP